LPRREPARLERPKTEFAKRHIGSAPRLAGHAAALLLPILHLLRHQHRLIPRGGCSQLDCVLRATFQSLNRYRPIPYHPIAQSPITQSPITQSSISTVSRPVRRRPLAGAEAAL